LIHQQVSNLKKYGIWFSLVLCGIAAAFLTFLAVISIWTGLNHLHTPGSWVPILAGGLAIPLVLWLFYLLARRVLSSLKEKDLINL
jgi:membrane protein implicated in regulation of membrane protease activity